MGAKAQLLLVPFCLHNIAVISEPLALPTMPRLRQRMSCTRGSSWGQVNHQASSSTTEPSPFSSDFYSDRHPVTRSGHGQGRGQLNLVAHSLNSPPNTTYLQFPCSLNNVSFLASVTIELSEVTSSQDSMTFGATLEMRAEDRHGTTQFDNKQSKAPGPSKCIATQVKDNQAGLSVPSRGGSSRKEGHPSEDEDLYNYGCRIIEDHPSTSHEA